MNNFKFTRPCRHCGVVYGTNANFSRYCADCAPGARQRWYERDKANMTPERRRERLEYFKHYYRSLTPAQLARKKENARLAEERRRRSRGVQPRKAPREQLIIEKLLRLSREEALASGLPRHVVLQRMGAPEPIVQRWRAKEGV